MTEADSIELAALVSSHLQELKGEALAAYLQNVYSLSSVACFSTDVIYAVEVAQGNMETGVVSSVPVRWWEIRNGDCRQIPMLNMNPFNAALDGGNVLWPHPIISYYAQLPLVLSKEGVSSSLKRSRILAVVKEQAAFRVLEEQRNWLFKG